MSPTPTMLFVLFLLWTSTYILYRSFILNNIISKNIEVLLFCHVCTDSPKNSYILVLNFKEFQPLSSIMGKILTPNPLIVSVLGLTLTCMYTRLLFFNIILNRALICSIFSSAWNTCGKNCYFSKEIMWHKLSNIVYFFICNFDIENPFKYRS